MKQAQESLAAAMSLSGNITSDRDLNPGPLGWLLALRKLQRKVKHNCVKHHSFLGKVLKKISGIFHKEGGGLDRPVFH